MISQRPPSPRCLKSEVFAPAPAPDSARWWIFAPWTRVVTSQACQVFENSRPNKPSGDSKKHPTRLRFFAWESGGARSSRDKHRDHSSGQRCHGRTNPKEQSSEDCCVGRGFTPRCFGSVEIGRKAPPAVVAGRSFRGRRPRRQRPAVIPFATWLLGVKHPATASGPSPASTARPKRSRRSSRRGRRWDSARRAARGCIRSGTSARQRRR
ncbi:MAG: hypothetical protein JWQ62_1855 [Lacunisphaera sp.]|nr:hypothetical protein [Lacunisphaera sp.]